MKRHILLALILLISKTTLNYGQLTAVEKGLHTITTDRLKAQLEFLSSDWMEGREAGEKGAYLAADYIASMLKLYGIQPFGDYLSDLNRGNDFVKNERSYFQNFNLVKTVPGDEQVLKIKDSNNKMVRSVDMTRDVDFTIRPGYQSLEIEAPVVFAGYGYIDDSMNYNDFSKLDVRGKYILKIAGFPKFVLETLTWQKAASLRKEMESRYRSMGVAGVLEYDPKATVAGRPEMKEFMNMSPSERADLSGRPHSHLSLPAKNNPDNFIRIEVSVRTANEILRGSEINTDDYILRSDGKGKYTIPELKGKSVYLKTTVKNSLLAVRNVLGIIEGKNPDSFIVIGAHYDHIGKVNGYIWNGADDNGSGTVGVMSIAAAVSATGEKPENSIIFALWTAEEEGLLGSRYFVRNPEFPVNELKLNMNFDMISRYISDNEPNKVTMTYTSSFPWFRNITSDNIKKYGIDLDIDYQPSDDPPGGTDHRSFVEAGIPVIRIKSGHREEYHTPKDEAGTLDWDIMEKIVKIGFTDTWDLANARWQIHVQ